MNNLPKLEALLFIYGEPIDIKKLAGVLNLSEDEVKSGLALLEEELKRDERGLTLVQDKNRVQLVTKPEHSKLLESITKEEFTEDLTPAALEALTIVAYAGPITRADLEYIRGVNSSFILRSLLIRGLIERSADPKRPQAYIYSASFDLLKKIGLSKNEDLPEYKKYNDLAKLLYEETKPKEVQTPQSSEVEVPASPADEPTPPQEDADKEIKTDGETAST